eukprot:CAMPEP_0168326024 /NCGR_PEP_ID=MMETSP0213-20121227/5044_1 /TAXON_ID=151035 /ORGANISM="Euplotes harpa, Strain FSP1.4" /LENGTH=86 /DNA_ID=CAMNT_0008328635 /DNA_START=511 /DNA_END=771 /DNA_ORIENTATION=-
MTSGLPEAVIAPWANVLKVFEVGLPLRSDPYTAITASEENLLRPEFPASDVEKPSLALLVACLSMSPARLNDLVAPSEVCLRRGEK